MQSIDSDDHRDIGCARLAPQLNVAVLTPFQVVVCESVPREEEMWSNDREATVEQDAVQNSLLTA
jgi:hypothetical protein